MKRLFETAELEAELFDMNETPEENTEDLELGLDELTEESMSILEKFSEGELEDFPALELTLELVDGRVLEYELAAVFLHGEKEYAALHPKSDSEGLIHIMELLQGENDEIELKQIESEEEIVAVYDTFYSMFSDDDFVDESYDEEFDEEVFEEEDYLEEESDLTEDQNNE